MLSFKIIVTPERNLNIQCSDCTDLANYLSNYCPIIDYLVHRSHKHCTRQNSSSMIKAGNVRLLVRQAKCGETHTRGPGTLHI